MLNNPLVRFLVFWGVNTLSPWVADDLFDGISFATPQSLIGYNKVRIQRIG